MRRTLFLLLAALLVTSSASAATQPRTFLPQVYRPSAVVPLSFWGMNAYLTKVERNGDSLPLLTAATTDAGARWTREELVWDLVEPRDNQFNPVYDATLLRTSQAGIGIIGVLITTPAWARDASCRPAGASYFCPPADVRQFAAYAAYMAERYDADGVNDAPGSPRVSAWEIWNEPNDVPNWPEIGASADARKKRYGDMLVAAHAAIKAADASALVLTGGTYIFDGSCAGGLCDGLNFFNAAGGVFQQVPAAKAAFDVFATHPYANPIRPDAVDRPRIVLLEGTTRVTRQWLDRDIGRPDAPIWITELGWCVSGGNCPGGGVSEDQQASYLVRSLVIAQQGGVQHVSWLQLEDAFNDPSRAYGNTAILRGFDGTNYSPRPAYNAYKTLATTLGAAQPAGTGPAHTHVYDPAQPFSNSGGTYNYRYQLGASTIDVLWRPNDAVSVSFPVLAGKTVTLVDRDGARTPLAPSNGRVTLNLSERPVIVVQQ